MLYGTLPARAREIQAELDNLYKRAMNPTLSSRDQRRLERTITALECELENILQNKAQAETPGGYYTSEGIKPASGTVVAPPALVLGAKTIEPKKNPWPWIVIALIAAGTTYYTIRG